MAMRATERDIAETKLHQKAEIAAEHIVSEASSRKRKNPASVVSTSIFEKIKFFSTKIP